MPYKDPDVARKYAKLRQRTYRLRHPRRIIRIKKKARSAAYQRWLLWFTEQKSKPCVDCRKKFQSCQMDFDHVRGRKLFCVGLHWGAPRARVIEEIAKCDLVCANCHRLRTAQRRQRAPTA